GDFLVGTATVENAGALRARSSTAGVAWKSSGSGGLIQLGRFGVPALNPGQRHKTHFRVRTPTNAKAAVYNVSVCADVLGQVRESSKKNECRKAGVITVGKPGSGVKGFGPIGSPPPSSSSPGGSSPPPGSPEP